MFRFGLWVWDDLTVRFLEGTGHIGAIGVVVGLLRRATEGGSFLVRCSLTQTANLAHEFGLYPGLEENDPEKRDERHWFHRVWEKYPAEPLVPDANGRPLASIRPLQVGRY